MGTTNKLVIDCYAIFVIDLRRSFLAHESRNTHLEQATLRILTPTTRNIANGEVHIGANEFEGTRLIICTVAESTRLDRDVAFIAVSWAPQTVGNGNRRARLSMSNIFFPLEVETK